MTNFLVWDLKASALSEVMQCSSVEDAQLKHSTGAAGLGNPRDGSSPSRVMEVAGLLVRAVVLPPAMTELLLEHSFFKS